MTSRVVVLSWINEFMVLPFLFFSPLSCFLRLRVEEPSGEKVLRLIQIRLMTSSFENIWPFCQPKRTKILKPKLPFAESAARRGWGPTDSSRPKISPRRARRTQRKTIKSLAAVNSVSSVVRFRFSNRSNPSRASSQASQRLPRTFRRDVFFPPPSFRARTEQCFCPCRVMKPLALDPENEKSHLAFRIFYPGILRA